MSRKFNDILIIVCLFTFFSLFGQRESRLSGFENLKLVSKLETYDKLSDSVKTINSQFLIKEISIHDTLDLARYTKFKLNLVLAELDYFNADYIKSINKYKAIYRNENLSLSERVDVLDRLKKTYYKLHLYPEIFEVNSTIKELIAQGANYPLWSYNMNSKLYGKLNLYDKAAIALKKEIQELKNTKDRDSLIIPSAYNDLGFYYYKSKSYDSAFVYYNKSITHASQSLKEIDTFNYGRILAAVKGNISALYVEKSQFKEAVPLLEESIRLGLKFNENSQTIIQSYNLLNRCYIELGDYDKAIKTFKLLSTFLPNQNQLNHVNYLRNKAIYFDKIKENDSSSYYFREAFRVKDSLDAKGMAQILASNELIYNRAEERKLKEQHVLDLKNQEIRIKNRQRNITITLAVLLLLFLMYSLYNSYYLKRSRKEVRLKNEQINKALKEKEVLLKEVHHRVKNNLQIISGLLELQQIDSVAEDVKIILKEGQNRIQSVALVHKMMYQSDNVSKVNMKNYLEELLHVLAMSYDLPNKIIETSVSAQDIHFDITKAVPLSLIVNEAVCNAYKHAFKGRGIGKINVSIKKKEEGTYMLLIKDDGIGLPKSFDIKNVNSIGFDLINGLTRQIKGQLILNQEEGTELKIIFNNT